MKKLLITMGCSWTQGEGIYSDESLAILRQTGSLPVRTQAQIELEQQYTWPTQLAQILNCDVINLAVGGGSNSGQAKRLIMGNLNTQSYDSIQVIWMLTESSRFSFYVNDLIREFQPQDHAYFFSKCSTAELELKKGYIGEVSTDRGEQLETEFYLKTVMHYCALKNYKFNYWFARNDWQINFDIKGAGNLEPNGYSAEEVIKRQVGEQGFAPCKHPNQLGYSIIARHVAQVLEKSL
jgi:hypothetical protein